MSTRRTMADAFPTVTVDDGSTYAVIPAHQRVRWTTASAHAAVAEGLALAATSERADLVALARQLGALADDDDTVIQTLASALVGGSLLAFEESPPPASGRPIIRRDPPVEPRTRPPPAITPGWVSFELVDHEGTPLGGLDLTFEHADGRIDGVTLDALGRSPRISTAGGGSIFVEWPKRLEAESRRDRPRRDGFAPKPDDVVVPRDPSGSTRLGLGRHWRVVVAAPPRQPTTSFPSAVFAEASALPMPAIHDLVTIAHESADRDGRARLGVFAHSDLEGDPQSNKALADRRAQAAFALLTGDWPLFERAVADEVLRDDRAQALLRALGCSPTAIDGEPGEQTALAVRAFRRGYNRDVWHAEGRARAYGVLDDGDAIDDATRKALLDAYHAEYAGRLDPARFVGPKFAGCGEFNPRAAGHADNRRVTLVVYGADAPRSDEFPCTRGDADACQIDRGADGGAGDTPHFRCKFYRERIAESDDDVPLTPFWDFEWLRTESGKAHLSALTHLADTDDVTFVVRRGRLSVDSECTGIGAPPDGTPPDATAVVAQLPGLIRSGVAYALWPFPGDCDPFDMDRWFQLVSPGALLRDFLPFYFTVEAHGRWGRSSPPGYRLREVTLGAPPDRGITLALRTDGTVLLLSPAEHAHAPKTTRVAGITGLRLRVDTFED